MSGIASLDILFLLTPCNLSHNFSSRPCEPLVHCLQFFIFLCEWVHTSVNITPSSPPTLLPLFPQLLVYPCEGIPTGFLPSLTLFLCPQLLVFPCKGVPTSLVLWTLLYAFIFFALFINFYVKAYLFGTERVRDIVRKLSRIFVEIKITRVQQRQILGTNS